MPRGLRPDPARCTWFLPVKPGTPYAFDALWGNHIVYWCIGCIFAIWIGLIKGALDKGEPFLSALFNAAAGLVPFLLLLIPLMLLLWPLFMPVCLPAAGDARAVYGRLGMAMAMAKEPSLRAMILSSSFFCSRRQLRGLTPPMLAQEIVSTTRWQMRFVVDKAPENTHAG